MIGSVPTARSREWLLSAPSWLISAAVLCWVLAMTLAFAAAGDSVLPGDVRFARWVQRADGQFAANIADAGNWAGAYWTGVGVSLLAILPLAWKKRSRAIVLLIAVAAMRALNNTIKGWIDSPRPSPDLVRVTEDAHGLGFPSGHASGAMLLFGSLAWIAWTTLPPGLSRTLALACSLAIIPVVGFGRIATGAHWPSDVLGGFFFGAAILGTLIIATGPHVRLER